MSKWCECGRRIKVRSRRKGWRGTPDKNHDLCQKCWRSLWDSIKRKPRKKARKKQGFLRGFFIISIRSASRLTHRSYRGDEHERT